MPVPFKIRTGLQIGPSTGQVVNAISDSSVFTNDSSSLASINAIKNYVESNEKWTVDSSNLTPSNSDYGVEVGAIEISEDSGVVSLIDMGVSSTPTAGTEESYSFNLDGSIGLKIYGESNGSGILQDFRVDIPIDLSVGKKVYYHGISEDYQSKVLYYNTTTGEITYQDPSGGGSGDYLLKTGDTMTGILTLDSSLLPSSDSTISIGASTNRFKSIYADEVFVGAQSLYINDKKVIYDESDTINISTDINQDLLIKTTGSGDSKIESDNGILLNVLSGGSSKDIELKTSSTSGSIILAANKSGGGLMADVSGNITFNSDGNTSLSAAGDLNIESIKFNGDIITSNIQSGNYIDFSRNINAGIVGNYVDALSINSSSKDILIISLTGNMGIAAQDISIGLDGGNINLISKAKYYKSYTYSTDLDIPDVSYLNWKIDSCIGNTGSSIPGDLNEILFSLGNGEASTNSNFVYTPGGSQDEFEMRKISMYSQDSLAGLRFNNNTFLSITGSGAATEFYNNSVGGEGRLALSGVRATLFHENGIYLGPNFNDPYIKIDPDGPIYCPSINSGSQTKSIFYNESTGEITYADPCTGSAGSEAIWGNITGTLSNQTDLQNALNAKLNNTTDTFTGILTVNGSLNIFGDIYQDGSSYITHAEQIYTEKDFIIMRDGATTQIEDGSIAGLKIVKANGTNDVILGTDSSAIMRVGWEGDTLQALATREDNPTNGYYAYWDSNDTIFKTKDLQGSLDSSLGDIWTELNNLDASISSSSAYWTLDGSSLKPKDDSVSLELNSIQLDEDAGAVILSDMSVTNTPTAGTEESYSMNLDGSTVMKIYGEADGTGALQETAVVVEAVYQYMGDPNTNGSWRFYISQDASADLVFEKRVGGSWTQGGRFTTD